MSKLNNFNLRAKVQKILIFTSIFFLNIQVWCQFFPIPNGWIDSIGRVYTCENCDSTFFSENEFVIYKKDNSYFFKNLVSEKEFKDNKYQHLTSFNDGLAIGKLNNKFQVIDTNGTKIFSFESH
jgi:hypothetical protein